MSDAITIQTQIGPVKILTPNFAEIPEAIRQLPSAFWTAEPELDSKGIQQVKANGRPRIKKAPRNAAGFNISKNKPEQWMTFATVAEAFNVEKFKGFGVLLQATSGLVGIDLDDITDLLNEDTALKKIIGRAKNAGIYCEQSPSGKGVRMFVYGALPNNAGKRKGGVELYSDAAFLTVTGLKLWPGEIKEAQWLVDELLDIIGAKSADAHSTQQLITYIDINKDIVSTLATWAEAHHASLWKGRWQDTTTLLGEMKYPSQSEADMALVGYLTREAFKRGFLQELVPGIVLATFTQSGLYRPEKHDQIAKYAIPKAVESAKESIQQLATDDPAASGKTPPLADTYGDVLNGRTFALRWKSAFIYVASTGKWLVWKED